MKILFIGGIKDGEYEIMEELPFYHKGYQLRTIHPFQVYVYMRLRYDEALEKLIHNYKPVIKVSNN